MKPAQRAWITALLGAGIVSAAVCQATPSRCPGDCNADGRVSIDELVIGVSMALGAVSSNQCPIFDTDVDDRVDIGELVDAINSALGGCPTPVPTATVIPDPTASGTPPAEPTLTPVSPPPTATLPAPDTPTLTAPPTAASTLTLTAPPTAASTATVPPHTPTATPSGAPSDRAALPDVAEASQLAARLAIASWDYLATLHTATLLALSGPESCPGGGTARASCTATTAGAHRAVVYENCRSSTSGGHDVERTGIVRYTLADCDNLPPQLPGNSDVELEAFRLVESVGPQLLLSIAVDLTSTVRIGHERCAGLDAELESTGVVRLTCAPGAELLRCHGGHNGILLSATMLHQEHVSAGIPCQRFVTARGGLRIEDEAANQNSAQVFHGLALAAVADGLDDADLLSVNGSLQTDCLGSFSVATTVPLRMPTNSACPLGGELRFDRASAGTTSTTSLPAGTAPSARALPGSGLRQFLFRSLDGHVYQVIQNDDTANGADALQITSVVGSLGDAVAACTNTAGSDANPLAATVVRRGGALSLDHVVRSEVVSGVALPCFNRNAESGAGRLCIGANCRSDCSCAAGAPCRTFTFDQGTRLDQHAPAGALAALDGACGTSLARETYAFGADEPTIERALCSAAPDDGLRLPTGGSLVVAYDTLPLQLVNAGVAGLPIDLDGNNNLCPQGPGVLSPGRALSDTAAAPRIAFTAAAQALFDYDGNGVTDQIIAGCDTVARSGCAVDPTPTPLPDPNDPCRASLLSGTSIVTQAGSTVGRPNAAGGAGCGWGGGNNGADHVYYYSPPVTGTYQIDVDADAFTPNLYVRNGTCLSEEAELGCDADADGDGRARLRIGLVAGERTAIVIDGADSRSGPFQLAIERLQPDLVIDALEAPETASGGDRITVSADVRNIGNGDAGPFAIDFAYARTAAADQLGTAFARCVVAAGLQAGEGVACMPATGLIVPLVANGEYRIIATADGDGAVMERDERNNTRAIATGITAYGSVLEQQLYRAGDGTVYQLIQAVPLVRSTSVGAYQLTTVAASFQDVDSCALADTNAGQTAHAAVGTAEVVPFDTIRRTGPLHPDDFSRVDFDSADGGELIIGSGADAVHVCGRQTACAGEANAALSALFESSQGIPAACLATLPAGGLCEGQPATSTVAFGLPGVGACQVGAHPTVETEICNAAPLDGLALRAGEAVVIVYDSGREPLQVGVAGFGIAKDESNPAQCAAGQVLEAEALTDRVSRASLLSFVQAQFRSRMTGSAAVRPALSPDGRQVYVATDGALAVLTRDPMTGGLDPIAVERNGVRGVRGLNGANSIALSPDGRHLYVAGARFDARGELAVFRRDLENGTLGFIEVERTGVGGVDGLDGGYSTAVVSPDGRSVYVVSGFGTLAAFARDEASGALAFIEVERDVGINGPASMVITPDGTRAYVAGSQSIATFARDQHSGALAFEGAVPMTELGELRFVFSVSLSPNGRHLYVPGQVIDGFDAVGAVGVFARDLQSGALDRIQLVRDGIDAVHGLDGASSIAFSPDSEQAYLTSMYDHTVTVFARDTVDGTLTFVELHQQGVGGVAGLSNADRLQVSPDGRHVYAVGSDNGLAAFERDGESGALRFLRVESNGVDGDPGSLVGFGTLTLSPDGRHAYDSAGVALFQRDPASGALAFVSFERPELFDARSAVVSPDGAFVYVAGGSEPSLTVFDRDQITGRLSVRDVRRDGEGADGLARHQSVAVSPDARHVYVASLLDEAVSAFARNEDGTLAFVDIQRQGVDGIDVLSGLSQVTVSPDGQHVYAAAGSNNSALAVFARDAVSGTLSFVAGLRDGVDGVDGLLSPQAIAISPDGRHGYVAAFAAASVLEFARDADTGRLTFLGRQRDGIDGVAGLGDPAALALSPDGTLVYVASAQDNAVAVLGRDAVGGRLHFIEVQREGQAGVSGLDGPLAITASADGRHVYVSSAGGRALTLFAVNQ
jgi:6-phosphogluconolactonase (cycloisomerase 2 family)